MKLLHLKMKKLEFFHFINQAALVINFGKIFAWISVFADWENTKNFADTNFIGF